ncbi:hypothetical protein U1Q18_051083 [Sarracenia purpurea var. burkii]
MFVRSSFVVMAQVATMMLNICSAVIYMDYPLPPEFDLIGNPELIGTIRFYGYNVGYFQVYNNWQNEIFVNEVSHRMADKDMRGHRTTGQNITIQPYMRSPVIKFIFEPEKLPNDNDQWSITAVINGVGKYTANNVCSVIKDDKSCGIVLLEVDPSNSNFIVHLDVHMQCTVPLDLWQPSSP